jgi:large subunit ribosomal protein L17
MITAFFEHERIETTHMKAKELRPMIEKMISKARVKSVTTLRSLLKVIRDKDVAFHLLDEVAPRFVSRPGGYTRIIKTRRRIGDGAEMAIIELVELGQSLSDKRSKASSSPSKPKSPSNPVNESKESQSKGSSVS